MTLATTPDVFENFSLNVVPKGENMVRAAKTQAESPVSTAKPVRGPKGTENEQLAKGASIPVMITKDTRQQLYDLGYKRAEVDKMTPQQAQDLLPKAISDDESAAFDTTKLPQLPKEQAPGIAKKVRVKKAPEAKPAEAVVTLVKKIIQILLHKLRLLLKQETADQVVDYIYDQVTGKTADGQTAITPAARAEAEKTFGKEAVAKAIEIKEGVKAPEAPAEGERRKPSENPLSVYSYQGDVVHKGIKPEETTTFSYGQGKPTIYVATDADIKAKYTAEKAAYKAEHGDLKGFDDYIGKAAVQGKDEQVSTIVDFRGLDKAGIEEATQKLKADNERRAEEKAAAARQKELESDFPSNPQAEWQKPATGETDYKQKRIIQAAALNGDFSVAIRDGEISYQQAVNILRSAEMAPTKDMFKYKGQEIPQKEQAAPTPVAAEPVKAAEPIKTPEATKEDIEKKKTRRLRSLLVFLHHIQDYLKDGEKIRNII